MSTKSSLVFFVSHDSQFLRMVTDTMANDGRVLILAFNQLEECKSFIQENPILILVHLNNCNEFTIEQQKVVNDLIQHSHDLKIRYILPSENEFSPIENYISLENVVFKSGDIFKEIKELIFSSL